MAVRVELTGYGREATAALRRAVSAAKAGDPLAPVTVVVPSNHVGVAARRVLASGVVGPVCEGAAGLAAVTFLTVYRLAELLGAPRLAAAGRRPVSTPVVAAAIRAALAAEPGVFASVADHPATETALVSASRELHDVPEAGLTALAGASRRAADVVRLSRAARRSLVDGWYDEQDLMEAAAGEVGRAAGELGPIILHLPQRLSLPAVALLRALADGHGPGLVVIAGSTGDARADAEVSDGLRRLDPSGPPLQATDVAAGGAEPAAGDGGPPAARLQVAPGQTTLVTTSDADEEVRAAVRAVAAAVRQGVPLERIAVLHAGAEPYARIVHDHLDAAGIAVNGSSVVPLAERTAGRALLQVLALPAGGFRRDEVMSWLSGAPVLENGRFAPVTGWERDSREAGVVAGRGEWDQRLVAFAGGLDAEAARLDQAVDGADTSRPVRSADAKRSQAERARRLRRFVVDLIDDLADAAGEPRSWSAHAGWARRLLIHVLGAANRRAAWPADEQRAANKVELAIDRLAALDAVEGAVSLDVFTRTLAIELDDDLGRVGRFGHGVLVGSLGMGLGVDLDLVVVTGLAEGTLPSVVGDDSLLPDAERDRCGGALALRSGHVHRQHRQLLAVLQGAGRQVLTIPRGDLRRSSQRIPSRWALDIASELAGRRLWSADLAALDEPWLEHVASFDDGLRRLTEPATAQEHRLRRLLSADATRLSATRLAHQADDERLAAAASVVAARRSGGFTRFDGNLSGCSVPSPVAEVMSSTRLERWAKCPFGYFARDVLRVEAVENPEDELEVSPADYGTLIHAMLERFMLEVLARPATEQPDPDDPWTDVDRARLAAIANEVCDEFERTGKTGRPVFWRRDRRRIQRELAAVLDHDERHRRRTRTRPLAVELAFGFRNDPERPPVALPLPGGRTVEFRGKADRVDIDENHMLHVVDYKTGSRHGYEKLSEENPDVQGQKLQLPVYGAAARRLDGAPEAVRAEYWFISSKGGFKRHGYEITDDVQARVGRTLAAIVAGIEQGVFPSRPDGKQLPWIDCPACDPDGLGTGDLRRAWERKREAPLIAAYASLAEPLDAIEGQVDDD